MMTPKEKAKELHQSFRRLMPHTPYTGISDGEAKDCSLICVNAILTALGEGGLGDSPYTTLKQRQFYIKVKLEIQNLIT